MFWALSNDSDGEQSLITGAHDVLVGVLYPSNVSAKVPEFVHVLGGDGIFLTSDFTTLIKTRLSGVWLIRTTIISV